MGNKALGIADPGYDALRIRSGQSIAPDLGGGSTGAGGLENKIQVWHADGSAIDLFDPDSAGFDLALTAAAAGDTVWLPSATISGNHTIPAGIRVIGISLASILSGTLTVAGHLNQVMVTGNIIINASTGFVKDVWVEHTGSGVNGVTMSAGVLRNTQITMTSAGSSDWALYCTGGADLTHVTCDQVGGSSKGAYIDYASLGVYYCKFGGTLGAQVENALEIGWCWFDGSGANGLTHTTTGTAYLHHCYFFGVSGDGLNVTNTGLTLADCSWDSASGLNYVTVGPGDRQIETGGPVYLVPSPGSGAGTEASPYTDTDNTAGIQTAINTLAAARGGWCLLKSARYDSSAAGGITITTPSIKLAGVSHGFNIDPNGQSEGISATKLRVTGDGIKLGTAGQKRGGIVLEDLYLWGAISVTKSAVAIVGQVDQFRLHRVNVGGNWTRAFYCNSVLDACSIYFLTALGVVHAVYLDSSTVASYTRFIGCELDDNSGYGFYASEAATDAQNRWLRLSNCTILRNAYSATDTPTDPANIYWGFIECVIADCIIHDAGKKAIDNSIRASVDGLILAGDRNVISGNEITDNSGYGIRIRGDGNIIVGNLFANNTSGNIIIEAGATGNVIIQPGLTGITDNGTGTIYVGTVTSIATGTGLTGGPITASGTISLNAALDDLNNVTAPSPSTNDVIAWNGSAWVQSDPNRIVTRAWGSMYQDDAGTTITVSATNTDYIVTGMSAGILGNVTFQNAQELVIVSDGVYQVAWSISFTCASANQEIEGAAGVGGVRQPNTSAHAKIGTGTDTVQIGGTGLLSLVAGNLVQLTVRNETGTNNISVQHANLSLVYLGLTTGGQMLLESGDALLLESGDNLLLEG